MSVSIIIPCYNQGGFLGEAIESALRQSVSPAEIIVVDDGSTDATRRVAKSFPGVDYVYQENQGLCAARNAGFATSRGEYVLFLDSDDRLLQNAVAVGLEALRRRPEAAFAYGRMGRIAPHGVTIGQRREPPHEQPYLDLFTGNFIPTPGMVLFRRSTLAELGLFDPRWPASADYDIYLRTARTRSIVGHGEIVVERRVHPDSMSADPALMLRSTLATHRKHWQMAPRSDPAFRKAYVEGRRLWRAWYGYQLALQVQIGRVQRRRRPVVRGLATLARYAPGQLAIAIRPPRRSREVEFRFVSKPSTALIPVSSAAAGEVSDGRLTLCQRPISVEAVVVRDGQLRPRPYDVLSMECRNAALVGTQLLVNERWYPTIRAPQLRRLAYLLPHELQRSDSRYRLQLVG